MADVVVINKVDHTWTTAVDTVIGHVQDVNPGAVVMRAASPVGLGPGPELRGRRVLVVEDGTSITHGGMAYGAGRWRPGAHAGQLVDPRPWAVGSMADMFARIRTSAPCSQRSDTRPRIRRARCERSEPSTAMSS